ncbi:MAG: hypothetical protein U0930_11210 [Pirellulales bacterium]
MTTIDLGWRSSRYDRRWRAGSDYLDVEAMQIHWQGAGRDTVRGGNQDDVLHGDDGIDQLFGDGGTDYLFGDGGEPVS